MIGELVCAREVAEVLGVSRRVVYDLAKRGQIPCYRFGACVRFRIDEILEAGRQEKAAPVEPVKPAPPPPRRTRPTAVELEPEEIGAVDWSAGLVL
ncbi:MAG: helix-turn-helix domain-containing protein [Alphaproteobacteria bacterium]|nr:helix-turn-helix domain-containing protein [Alphaproteobacteria bacterium]